MKFLPFGVWSSLLNHGQFLQWQCSTDRCAKHMGDFEEYGTIGPIHLAIVKKQSWLQPWVSVSVCYSLLSVCKGSIGRFYAAQGALLLVFSKNFFKKLT